MKVEEIKYTKRDDNIYMFRVPNVNAKQYDELVNMFQSVL